MTSSLIAVNTLAFNTCLSADKTWNSESHAHRPDFSTDYIAAYDLRTEHGNLSFDGPFPPAVFCYGPYGVERLYAPPLQHDA